jgi:hypothetical protein
MSASVGLPRVVSCSRCGENDYDKEVILKRATYESIGCEG